MIIFKGQGKWEEVGQFEVPKLPVMIQKTDSINASPSQDPLKRIKKWDDGVRGKDNMLIFKNSMKR